MIAYNTIEELDARVETLYEIQKSKFITHLRHVDTEDEAREFITAMKKRYYDARHNCSAYVLGERSDKQKSNDDGEPGGTAGNPILEAIKAKNLTNIVVVVTRYFGGIKLGAGGLIRAYSHAATMGIDAASKIAMTPFTPIEITIGYDLLASLEHYLRQNAIKTGETDYGSDVTLRLLLTEDRIAPVLEDITNLTSDNFLHEKGEEQLVPLPIE